MPVAMGTTKQLAALRTPVSQSGAFKQGVGLDDRPAPRRQPTGQPEDVQQQRVGQLVEQTGAGGFGLHRRDVARAPDPVDQPAGQTDGRTSS